MVNTLKLIVAMIWLNIRARSMYLVNFVTALVQSSIMTVVSAGLIWIVLDKFQNINGWTLFEVGFMYAFAKLATSLVMTFFSVLFAMDTLINLGEIDRLLLRPKSPFLLFIFQRFDIMFLGDVAAGLFILLYCAGRIGIAWTPVDILLLCVMLLSASLTYFSLLFLTGTTAFWFLKSGSLKSFVMEVFNIFNPYPIDIYSKGIQIVLSVIVPFAFVYYFPALHFLPAGGRAFPSWCAFFTPLVAVVFTGLAIGVWRLGLRNYKSSGT